MYICKPLYGHKCGVKLLSVNFNNDKNSHINYHHISISSNKDCSLQVIYEVDLWHAFKCFAAE